MFNREVTERDFRCPEYRDAKIEDYEFREDGKLVRKDRWEMAIRSIGHIVCVAMRDFEVADVVNAVRKVAEDNNGWQEVVDYRDDPDLSPDDEQEVDVLLQEGSILRAAVFKKKTIEWLWHGRAVYPKAWKERRDGGYSTNE